ncbi:MAG TPA: helix-turn-helix domain-containing protein [Bacilli bacterium]|nr:helix-turn-helix domain-containing protein [Bacilli bacterium]
MSSFSIGQKIRELRTKKRMTQITLAKGLCTPSMISQIESDRARPSYKVLSKIAERLEVPVDRLLADEGMNLEVHSTYRLARALLASREYETVIPMFLDLLEGESRVHLPTLEVRLELATCYIELGRFDEATPLLQHVEEYADFRYDYDLLTRTYRLYAQIDMRYKRYTQALYRLQQAWREFGKIEVQDPFDKADLLCHFGRSYAALRRTEQALDSFHQAAALYSQGDTFAETARVYREISESHRRQQNLELAADYATRAATLYEALNTQVLRAQMQTANASLLARSGQLQEAVTLLERTIPDLQRLNRREDVGLAYLDLANLHVQNSDWTRAEECALVAQSLLPDEHAAQASVLLTLGKMARRRKQTDTAMRDLQQAAQQFEQEQDFAQWEEAMLELSQLYLEQKDWRKAYGVSQEILAVQQHLLEERGVVL